MLDTVSTEQKADLHLMEFIIIVKFWQQQNESSLEKQLLLTYVLHAYFLGT